MKEKLTHIVVTKWLHEKLKSRTKKGAQKRSMTEIIELDYCKANNLKSPNFF